MVVLPLVPETRTVRLSCSSLAKAWGSSRVITRPRSRPRPRGRPGAVDESSRDKGRDMTEICQGPRVGRMPG